MKVLVTGASGFVGTQLCRRLVDLGRQVTGIAQAPHPSPSLPSEVRYLSADTTQPGPWQEAVADQDMIINLAGASIFRRWTAKSKEIIYNSRILTTRNLVNAIPQGTSVTLLSTSAVGYYGSRGDASLTEDEPPGSDFLASLCVDWEAAASAARSKGARVVCMRFGIVLGKTGGALGQMIPAFKRFVGGPLGDGRQWFSWIHMEDLIGAMLFIMGKDAVEGPVNFCAPNPVRNETLAHVLGKLLHRPSFLKTPAFAIKLALGEFGSVLLEGQRVFPAVLLRHGYTFQYPDIEAALAEVLGVPVSKGASRV
ncbi:MAG: TIGR01777 family oxidoreductase [Desulfosoma sp.]